MAQKIFVGGLAFSTSSEALRAFFEQCGAVLSAQIVTDHFSNRSRGFGFVEMATAEEANRAVNQLNGRDLDGRQLQVEMAKPKTDSRGRGRGGGGGFGGRGGYGRPG